MSEVMKRYSTDDAFREVANLLFGGGGDDLIHKANPDGSTLCMAGAAKKKREKFERRQAQVGLASNVVGLAAGAVGTKDAFQANREVCSVKTGGTLTPKPRVITGRTKALAAGALGLQVANVAGDAVANRVLARGAKKKQDIHKRLGHGVLVSKSIADIEEQASFPNKGQLTRASITSAARASGKGAEYVKANKGKLKALPDKVKTERVRKNDEPMVEISKVNEDKRQVFGWASVVEKNGEPVVDLQGDFIPVDEMERAAFEFVRKSRKGGDMHQRNGEHPLVIGDMIESFVVTQDKKDALGLPDDMPIGWWVGFQVEDENTWAKIKSGERTGFSVHGVGKREPHV